MPVAVTGLSSGVSQVVAGRLLTLACTTAGAVHGWGDNTYGLIANRPDSTWTRYITAIDGDMAATLTSTGQYRYTISNIRGDVVADADSNGLAQAVAIDEFGNPASNLPGDRRYGFMGDKQREALTPRGTVAMGVRLYVPGIGRFLQVDPVLGGSDGPFDYGFQDPVNTSDLDGRCPMCAYAAAIAIRAGIIAYRARKAAQAARATAAAARAAALRRAAWPPQTRELRSVIGTLRPDMIFMEKQRDTGTEIDP